MESQKNYKSFWNEKASTPDSAFIAVDGSTNEETARLTGTYSGHQVTAALDLQPGDRVLELGCGVGRIGREIAPRVAHWEGTDISSNMIEVARERLAQLSNVGFTELTRSSLQPLADASFDKAYCVAVFIHMDKEDFFLYLQEMARVLKPGGLIYFDTWNMAVSGLASLRAGNRPASSGDHSNARTWPETSSPRRRKSRSFLIGPGST